MENSDEPFELLLTLKPRPVRVIRQRPVDQIFRAIVRILTGAPK